MSALWNHVEELDPWDPNNWEYMFAQQDAEPCHIYLDNNASEWAVIDAIDYPWAIKNCWCAKRDPTGSVYARRAVGESANGMRLRTYTVYLHIEVMKRTRIRRPSKFHWMVDHRDGDTLNCRRSNLRWATSSMNQLNRWAQRPRDLIEDGGLIDGTMVDAHF